MPTAHSEALTVFSAPADRPAAEHPDLNLALRGYSPTGAAAALVDISARPTRWPAADRPARAGARRPSPPCTA